jgi:hypothetical protein
LTGNLQYKLDNYSIGLTRDSTAPPFSYTFAACYDRCGSLQLLVCAGGAPGAEFSPCRVTLSPVLRAAARNSAGIGLLEEADTVSTVST